MAQEYLPQPCTGPKQELITFLKGGKWGFCNRDKKLVIPAVYDDAAAFGTVPLNAGMLYYPTPEQASVRPFRPCAIK
ncbi:WG repeat-containing protein [Chitinophaga sp. GCM10012297]|uniref:WG repeat-containing protein n=1 Tax=Chitinophaga chungangae TaxID=2821488 RepID=A0ABS3Y7C2_9BACT|nr:WG repeat-containing protein [Chitinophaga chungangae]MBO9150584.1 WG repeat-containing protein [Chitinophaga chungangae]